MRCRIDCADALTWLPTLPDQSVALIATDPPYYRVKSEDWDRQWKTPADYLAWLGRVADQWKRVLKPNGSLYCFAGPDMAARVEVMLAERFEVLNRIVWVKNDGTANQGGLWSRASKEALRSYFPQTEYVIFCEQRGADSMALGESGYTAKCEDLRGFVFEPLRAYLATEFAALGWNADRLNDICGTASMAGRHFAARSQWCLPTAAHYSKLQAAANDGHLRREYGHLRREYEDLRREYEDLRREYEDLRRPFSVTPDVPYTDVWTFPTVPARSGKHPCEKPLAMMEHIVRTSSRPGDVVLDSFAGGGASLVAADRLGRVPWGCDSSERWANRCRRRLAHDRLPLFVEEPTP